MQLNVGIVAFGEQAALSVAYDVGVNVGVVSTPFLGTIGVNMNACTDISNFVTVNVSHTGALLGPANTLPLFNQTNALLDVREFRTTLFLAHIPPIFVQLCVETISGTTPLARRSPSPSLYKRAPFSCPNPAPTAISPIIFTAMST